MLATPDLFRPDQSLPAASTPAPGPHTSGFENSISRVFRPASALSGLLRGFFSRRSTSLGNRHEAWTYNGSVSASRHPGRTYEPLDVFVHCRRRAAAILRYGRNPCVIQADSEPPGRHPPAPGSHIRRSTPSPGDLSLAKVWWGFPRLSSIPAPSLSSSRNPSSNMGLAALP
jgi:hypothetical protein